MSYLRFVCLFIFVHIKVLVNFILQKYFKLGVQNIRLNNGESAVTDDHIQAVCRQILEEVCVNIVCVRAGEM